MLAPPFYRSYIQIWKLHISEVTHFSFFTLRVDQHCRQCKVFVGLSFQNRKKQEVWKTIAGSPSPPVVCLCHCMVSHIQQPHRSCFMCSRQTARAASSSSHKRCWCRRSVQYMATPRNDINRKRQVNRARWGWDGVVSQSGNRREEFTGLLSTSVSAVLFSDVSFLVLTPQRPPQPMFWWKIWCDCMFTVTQCTRCVFISTIRKWVRVAHCALHGNQMKSKAAFFSF